MAVGFVDSLCCVVAFVRSLCGQVPVCICGLDGRLHLWLPHERLVLSLRYRLIGELYLTVGVQDVGAEMLIRITGSLLRPVTALHTRPSTEQLIYSLMLRKQLEHVMQRIIWHLVWGNYANYTLSLNSDFFDWQRRKINVREYDCKCTETVKLTGLKQLVVACTVSKLPMCFEMIGQKYCSD